MKEIHALRDPVFSGNLRAAFGTVGGENLPGSSAPHLSHSRYMELGPEPDIRSSGMQPSASDRLWDMSAIRREASERRLTL
jgi:hypothetical protein